MFRNEGASADLVYIFAMRAPLLILYVLALVALIAGSITLVNYILVGRWTTLLPMSTVNRAEK